jgi:hypothetical protein
MPKVIKIQDFDLNNVRFSVPKQMKHGGKTIYINYDYQDGNGPKPLRIQLPRLKVPFGISGWDGTRADKSDLSPTEQSNDTIEFSTGEYQKEVTEKIEALDKKVIDYAIKNKKEIFKKKLDDKIIKLHYKSPIKYSENEDGDRSDKYPPRLKTKVYKQEDFSYRFQAFDVDKKPVKMSVYNHSEYLPKGGECIALLECGGIWIINDNFGVSWRPAQLKVFPNSTGLSEYAFVEEVSEELEKTHITEENSEDDDL